MTPSVGRPARITKRHFLEVIEGNIDGKPDYELAEELGITPEWFSHLRKRHTDDIVKLSNTMIRKRAEKLSNDLLRESGKDLTAATKAGLEIVGTYQPSTKHVGDPSKPVAVLVLPEREIDEPLPGEEDSKT